MLRRIARIAGLLLILAMLLAAGSAEGILPGLEGTWYGGEDYGSASRYWLTVTERGTDDFRFEFSCYRIDSFEDCYAYISENNIYFEVYDADDMWVMGGEISFFDEGDVMVLHFDWSIADYLEDLAGQTIVFERR